jgi:subtilisin family serine protease
VIDLSAEPAFPVRTCLARHPSRPARIFGALAAAATLVALSVGPVAASEPRPVVDPFQTPYFSNLGVASAWQHTVGSPSVIVAVIDTGLDTSDGQFSGHLVPGYNALTNQETASAGLGVVADTAGHGTLVTSVILGAAPSSGRRVAGIAPGVRVMPVKVSETEGVNAWKLYQGIDWAARHGASVIVLAEAGNVAVNDSLTTSLVPYFAALANAGIVVVTGSGNIGKSEDLYPCAYPGVICVGGSSQDGSKVWSYETSSANIDLVAPADQIMGMVPNDPQPVQGSGTTLATAITGGAVALVRSQAPNLTPAQIATLLTTTAQPVNRLDRGATAIGAGGLNLAAVFTQILNRSTGRAPLIRSQLLIPLPTPPNAALGFGMMGFALLGLIGTLIRFIRARVIRRKRRIIAIGSLA